MLLSASARPYVLADQLQRENLSVYSSPVFRCEARPLRHCSSLIHGVSDDGWGRGGAEYVSLCSIPE
jgi:hypothetical protein